MSVSFAVFCAEQLTRIYRKCIIPHMPITAEISMFFDKLPQSIARQLDYIDNNADVLHNEIIKIYNTRSLE